MTLVKRKAAWRQSPMLWWLVFASSLFVAGDASADITIWKSDKGDGGWEVFTNGRVGTFFSWAKGDGQPQSATFDPNTDVKLHGVNIEGQGLQTSDVELDTLPLPNGMPSHRTQTHVNSVRIRSGMIGNVLGFGVRRNLQHSRRAAGHERL